MWAALLGVLVASPIACSSSPGRLAARQTPAAVPRVQQIREDGVYGLFVAGDGEPLFRTLLHQGDNLGFTIATAATVGSVQVSYLYAVYGENRYHLDPNKTYEWRWLYAPRSSGGMENGKS